MTAVPAPESGPDAGAVWHYGDPFGEQRAAQHDAVFVNRSHRAVLTLSGADRLTWLHSITTQFVSDLADGASTQNLSLDGQGRVEDHWIQTDLGGVTYIDTEPWRGEPLLTYLKRMVFWADVVVEQADLAVLSLLGPRWADAELLGALGVDALPGDTAVALADGGLLRRNPAAVAGEIELDLLIPKDQVDAVQQRLTQAGARPAGVWAYEALRVAARRPRLGVDTDERTIPHEVSWIGQAVHLEKGCYRGQETVARVHNLGKPPRMLVAVHLDGSTDRPQTGDSLLANGRAVGRLGTVVDHVDDGPIALALLKRGLTADVELLTGGDTEVAVAVDPDSLPSVDAVGAGRLAVERLRGGR